MSEQFGQYVVSDAKDFLNMRCGQPAPYYLDEFQKCLDEYNCADWNGMSTGAFQYGKKDGFDSFKKMVIFLMNNFSFTPDSIPLEHIFMTNGVTQGFQLLSSYFKSGYLTEKPIDILYVEELTYFLIKTHLENIGINVKTFSFKNLEKLNEEIAIHKTNNINIAFYIIPFCHNPTGKTVRKDVIQEFLTLTKEYLVISDETYLFLHRGDKKFKSLYFLSSNVVALHTFSKIMAPGLRLGFILTQNEMILKKLDSSGFMESGGAVNQLMAYILERMATHYMFHIHTRYYNGYHCYLTEMKGDLNKKMEFVESVLDLYPEYISYEKPDGGYFIFFKVNNVCQKKFEQFCEECKLSFHNGSKFGSEQFSDYYRLSVSYYSLDNIKKYFPDRFKMLIEKIKIDYVEENNSKIYVLGYKGRLGSLIMEELTKSTYDYFGLDRGYDVDTIKFKSNDIIIDVSSPQGLEELLTKLLNQQNKSCFPKIITGTTGINGTSVEKLIEEYGVHSTIIVKSNFSRGILSILNSFKSFDKDYWNITIQDVHHTKKKDSPSGTALTLQKELEKITSGKINIDSTRVGDIIGLHEIRFKTPTETITITHEVTDRRVFAVGCVRLIENIQKINNGVIYNNV